MALIQLYSNLGQNLKGTSQCIVHARQILTNNCLNLVSIHYQNIDTINLIYLDRIWFNKRHQCFHGNNPGRDGGPKILAQEWT